MAQITLNSSGVASSGSLLLQTNGTTTQATVDTSGNLGLGVTPSAWGTGSSVRALQFNSGSLWNYSNTAVYLGHNYYFNGTNRLYSNTGPVAEYQLYNGTHAWNIAGSGSAGAVVTFTQAMTLDASGNLGVGTTSPSVRLHIVSPNSTTQAQITLADTDGRTLVVRSPNSGSPNIAQIGTTTNHDMSFLTGNTERARIDSSGNLLVGTTNSAYSSGERISISPASGKNGIGIALGNTNNVGIGIYNGYTATGTATAVQFQDHNSIVRGSITVTTSATAYVTSSDYRLKENIQPMTGALATVAQLNPVTYNWKADGSASQGFIAHELQAVVPDAVVGEKDAVDENGNPKYQGIDTSFLVATLTAAIQELNAKFEAYKAAHP